MHADEQFSTRFRLKSDWSRWSSLNINTYGKIFVAQTVERGGGISCNLYKSKDHVVYFLKNSNEVEGSSPFKGPKQLELFIQGFSLMAKCWSPKPKLLVRLQQALHKEDASNMVSMVLSRGLIYSSTRSDSSDAQSSGLLTRRSQVGFLLGVQSYMVLVA